MHDCTQQVSEQFARAGLRGHVKHDLGKIDLQPKKIEEDRTDANYEPLQENLARLREMNINKRKLDVATLPMPKKMVREDLRLPTSYANFYIANTCVLLPTYADPNDKIALSTVQKFFPNRRVIGIDCRELIWGLGAFHCLTQQQPAVL